MYADTVLTNATRNLKTGRNTSMQVNISVTATAVVLAVSVTLPDTASMVRTYSSLAHRVALSEAPVAISTATFVVGAIVNAAEWGTFALANGLTRTLQILTVSTGIVFLETY